MNEKDFQDALKALLREVALMDEAAASAAGVPDALINLRRVRTYEEEGILTQNAGMVITTASGETFQLTLVRSR